MASVDPAKIKSVKELGRKEISFAVARAANSSRLFVGGSDFMLIEIDPLAEKPELFGNVLILFAIPETIVLFGFVIGILLFTSI